MRDFFRPARLGVGGSGIKLSLLAQNAPKRGISGVPGEFCTGWARRGRVLGEFFRGKAAGGAVLGEFFRVDWCCAQVLLATRATTRT